MIILYVFQKILIDRSNIWNKWQELVIYMIHAQLAYLGGLDNLREISKYEEDP